MVEILIPAAVIGLIASVVTELLKLFPFLSATDERKRILALVICLVFSFIYVGTQVDFTTTSVLGFVLISLSATFTAFKAVVQPVEAILQSVGRVLGIVK